MKTICQPKASGTITPRQKKALQPSVFCHPSSAPSPDYDYDSRLGTKRILLPLLQYIYDAIRTYAYSTSHLIFVRLSSVSSLAYTYDTTTITHQQNVHQFLLFGIISGAISNNAPSSTAPTYTYDDDYDHVPPRCAAPTATAPTTTESSTLTYTETPANSPYPPATETPTTTTDVHYYGYRYYNPELGRFVNKDPIEEKGGLNLYLYVQNNPLSFIDAYGLWGTAVHQTKTIEWAQADGMPSRGATPIGEWDEKVDTDFDPTDISDANWSWHFDRSGGGMDSRLKHTQEQFEEAKKLCTWNPDHKDDWQGAAKAMGRALHPLQDWVAHGDFNRKQEMPSLTGYGWLEKRFYAHNYSAPGGINTWKLPDREDLDSTGPNGRATISVMTYRGSLSNGDKYYSATFSAGTQRIALTETKTKEMLKYFRNHVKRYGGCECKRAFLSPSDMFGYGP